MHKLQNYSNPNLLNNLSSEKLSYSNTINVNNLISRENLKDFENLGELKLDYSNNNLNYDDKP